MPTNKGILLFYLLWVSVNFIKWQNNLQAQPASTINNNNAHSLQLIGTVGIAVDIGLKVNRLGIFANGGLIWAYKPQWPCLQLNTECRAYYCLNTFGPPKKRYEWQSAAGILGSWGKKDSTQNNPFYGITQNQTQHPIAIAYAYRIYADNIGTSQHSGTMSFQYKNWQLIIENDVLAGKGQDKFRTGAFKLGFQQQQWAFGLLNILWTCSHKGAKRIKDNPYYPAQYGYYDISQNEWRIFSMGILALQIRYAIPQYKQFLSVDLGIDDERVRHIIQNKLIHDMPFIPKKYNKARNPHLPIIAADSSLYLFDKQTTQKIRPTKAWLQMGLNSGDFY